MILDNIKNAARYEALPYVVRALSYAEKYSDESTPIGRHEIDEKLAAVYNSYMTTLPEADKYENHREWIDVQYVIEGVEEIRVCPREGMEPATEFDVPADYEFCKSPEHYTSLILKAGDFAVLWPDETHSPQLAANGEPAKVRKIIFKVKE